MNYIIASNKTTIYLNFSIVVMLQWIYSRKIGIGEKNYAFVLKEIDVSTFHHFVWINTFSNTFYAAATKS